MQFIQTHNTTHTHTHPRTRTYTQTHTHTHTDRVRRGRDMRAAKVSILNFFSFHSENAFHTHCDFDWNVVTAELIQDFFYFIFYFLQEDAATKTKKRGR
jgi:hypothetical protein